MTGTVGILDFKIPLCMYKYIIKQLKKENKILYSDLRQTPDAKRVWDSLVRDGYASFDGERFHSI